MPRTHSSLMSSTLLRHSVYVLSFHFSSIPSSLPSPLPPSTHASIHPSTFPSIQSTETTVKMTVTWGSSEIPSGTWKQRNEIVLNGCPGIILVYCGYLRKHPVCAPRSPCHNGGVEGVGGERTGSDGNFISKDRCVVIFSLWGRSVWTEWGWITSLEQWKRKAPSSQHWFTCYTTLETDARPWEVLDFRTLAGGVCGLARRVIWPPPDPSETFLTTPPLFVLTPTSPKQLSYFNTRKVVPDWEIWSLQAPERSMSYFRSVKCWLNLNSVSHLPCYHSVSNLAASLLDGSGFIEVTVDLRAPWWRLSQLGPGSRQPCSPLVHTQ